MLDWGVCEGKRGKGYRSTGTQVGAGGFTGWKPMLLFLGRFTGWKPMLLFWEAGWKPMLLGWLGVGLGSGVEF